MSAGTETGFPFYAFAGAAEARSMLDVGRVPGGLWALRLRAPEIEDRACIETALALRALFDSLAPARRPFLSCDFRPALTDCCPADFFHFRVSDLEAAAFAGLSSDLCRRSFLSAHSRAELEFACEHGIGRAVLSPVFEPLSDKAYKARPLGPEAFCAMVRDFPGLDIFALGGVNRDRLAVLRASGCAGVAGISFLRERL